LRALQREREMSTNAEHGRHLDPNGGVAVQGDGHFDTIADWLDSVREWHIRELARKAAKSAVNAA
jgi:hypothetical protein